MVVLHSQLTLFHAPALLRRPKPPPATPAASSGVDGAAVESPWITPACAAFTPSSTPSPADPESLIQRDALDFHRVTRELFQQSAIIPFRFPTPCLRWRKLTLTSTSMPRSTMPRCRNFATRCRWKSASASRRPQSPDAATGAAYLETRAQRARQVEQAIAACRAAINEEVIDWRQRESSHGVRCFVLIRREAVGSFQQQIKQVRLDGGGQRRGERSMAAD